MEKQKFSEENEKLIKMKTLQLKNTICKFLKIHL